MDMGTHARSELLRRLGQRGEAAAAYRRALQRPAQAPERRFTQQRINEVETC